MRRRVRRIGLVLGLALLAAGWPGGSAPAVSREMGPQVLLPHRFRLEAGQVAAFRWSPEHGAYHVEAAPASPPALSPEVERAVGRVPAWLRENLRAQLRRLERTPIRVPAGSPSPGYYDVTGDGRHDLLVWDGAGDPIAFAAPDWRRVATIDRSRLPGEWLTTNGPVSLDANADGHLDRIRVDAEGFLVFRRGRGAPGRTGWLEFRHDPTLFFPHRGGTAVRPAVSDETLVLGDLDGRTTWWADMPEIGWTKVLEHPDGPVEPGLRFSSPAIGDLDGDGWLDVVLGHEDGGVRVFRSPERSTALTASGLGDGLSAGAFSSPALGDVDGDGDLDLLCGNRDGRVLLFANEGSAKQPRFATKAVDLGIDVEASSAPAAGDVDGDGRCDLIVGNQAGTLRLFRGPDWKEDPAAFADLDLGELATPAIDPSAGGRPARLVVGNLDGDLVLLEAHRSDDGLRIVERDSWSFVPEPGAKTIEERYRRVYFPEEEPLLGRNDDTTLAAYVDLLLGSPPDLVDEVAFAVAHTPAEVLRATARLGSADVLLENAKALRDVAAKVPYARLVEEGDHTTVEYVREDGQTVRAPRDVYYWWIVHPRILYEIPCRVDTTWWATSAEARGMKDSPWWKRASDPDVHAPTDAALFWRTALLKDGRYGEPLEARISRAKTLREALLAVNEYMAHGRGFMRFGYETQDMQPWLIHAKSYGSCGEHSIVAAAMARASLIPSTVVTDRGEDHQWNEWWDVDGRWHHWDASGGSVDTPWSSTEGREHAGKTVSSVTRWRGDDRMEDTTTTVWNPEDAGYTERGRGYTDVGSLAVRVLDPMRRPVDGALVMLRSHWDNRNMVALWGHTDADGRSPLFGLGYEPNGGYTVEVLTPLGSAGVRSFPIEEGRHHALTLTTPEEKPAWTRLEHVKPAVKPPDGKPGRVAARIVEAEIRPPSPITAGRYRIGSYMTEKHGYRGTRGQAVPVDSGPLTDVLVFSPEEYRKFERGEACRPWYHAVAHVGRPADWPSWPDRGHVVVLANVRPLFTAVEIEIAGAEGALAAAPLVVIDAALEGVVRQGEVHTLACAVEPVSAVRRLVVRSAMFGERDVTDALDRESGAFRVEVDTGDGGPWPAGVYDVTVVAEIGRASAEATATLRVEPARVFEAQRIRQDDPDDPLGGRPWTYGPFDLDGTDRFFLARTRSLAEGFDCDVHLYRDKNGNGRIDGLGERVASGTSPTGNERVYLEKPPAGTYWLVCQGWQVEGEWALLDVEVHPRGVPRAIVDVSPVGRVREAPAEIAASFLPFAQVDPESVVVKRRGMDRTTRSGPSREGIRWNPGPPLGENVEETFEVTVRHRSGRAETRTWTVVVDTLPPTLEVISPEAGSEVGDEFRVEVKAADEAPGVTVFVRVPGGPERRLKPVKDREGVFALNLKTESWPAGERYVWLVARDAAGNETERVLPLIK